MIQGSISADIAPTACHDAHSLLDGDASVVRLSIDRLHIFNIVHEEYLCCGLQVRGD